MKKQLESNADGQAPQDSSIVFDVTWVDMGEWPCESDVDQSWNQILLCNSGNHIELDW